MKPPADLGADGAAYWREITKHWRLDAHQPAILAEACRCLDTIKKAESAMADSGGPIVQDRFSQCKPHPSVNVIRDFRGLFARLVRELGLSAAAVDGARPPALTNRYKSRR